MYLYLTLCIVSCINQLSKTFKLYISQIKPIKINSMSVTQKLILMAIYAYYLNGLKICSSEHVASALVQVSKILSRKNIFLYQLLKLRQITIIRKLFSFIYKPVKNYDHPISSSITYRFHC